MERSKKAETGNGSPIVTEDQIKLIIQKYLPQFLKELESSAPDMQTFSSAQGFADREDKLKNFSTSKDTELIERVVRVEEGLKALRDHVDIRFEETKKHTDLRFEETKKHTDLRFEETRKHTDLRFEETKEHIEQLRTETKEHIEQLRTETKEHIEQLRTETKEHIEIRSREQIDI